MSIRVMNWVWQNSPTGGNELLLLLAIADAADDNGRNAYPSIQTLATKTRLGRRTVQRLIARLVEDGHLTVGKPGGGRVSNSYTIHMPATPTQDSPAEPGDDGPQANEDDRSGTDTAGDAATDAVPTGRQELPQQPQNYPGLSTTGVILALRQNDTGVTVTRQQRHSCDTPAASQLWRTTPPVTVLDPPPPRTGRPKPPADTAPPDPQAEEETTNEPAPNPSAPATEDALVDVAEVLNALPLRWRVGRTSARRLAEPVRQALAAGWEPRALAGHLGANPGGVRSPYAVLTARLADLPPPPATPAPRPPWCRQCDHPDSRLIELDNDQVTPCPICNPIATSTQRRREDPSRQTAPDENHEDD